MPPESWIVPRFAAEPPQEQLPSGRWAETLRAEFLGAVLEVDDDLGDIGDIVWFPDRTYAGRTFVPATARAGEIEVFGYVSYVAGDEPGEWHSSADSTDELAENNPEWQVDLCDEVIGQWRGPGGKTAQMTLVWGVPQVPGGAIATAELGNRVRVTVDQCELVENRLTLLAPDDIAGDTLEVRVYDARGNQVAAESLYED